jgi:hypothetical protein
MLLYTVTCPLSFEYLRTYEGIVYPTFQAACLARGLLETDDEWDICLTEATAIQSGKQLRRLFVNILLTNSPADPHRLFQQHVAGLSDDCRHRLRTLFNNNNPTADEVTSLALQYIDVLLQKSGKTLADYSLPAPTHPLRQLDGIPRILAEEMNYDRDSLIQKWDHDYPKANAQQKQIIDAIVGAVENEQGKLFFIDGPGGTGKTFVENLILARIRSQGHIALAVASSGIAAILLDGGRTSHSRFKIPIDILQDSICNVTTQSTVAQLLNQTKLIIWDEAPAQHRYCFEAVDRTLRDIRKTNSWFGGITVVFAGTSSAASISNISIGDFRQCLPVIPGGSRGQITNAAISNASFWKDTTIMRLTVNMRLLAQARHMSPDQLHYTQDFAAWLLNVGNGSINEENNVNLPRSTCPLCFLS